MHLARDLSASALYDGCDKARLVPRKRVTKDLVRQLVETRGRCVPRVSPRQVLSEVAQSELEFNFRRRSLPGTQQGREGLPLRCRCRRR